MRPPAPLACATAAVLIAGCGSSSSNPPSAPKTTSTPAATATNAKTPATAPAPTGYQKTVALKYQGSALAPATITIPKPGQVTFQFTNSGKASEALEVKGPGVDEESGVVDGGATTSLTVLLAKGTYTVDDGLPSGPKMQGTVVVR
jgi:plastocyanin